VTRSFLYRVAALPALLLLLLAMPVVLLSAAIRRLRADEQETFERTEYVLLPPTHIRP
jgi:CheY-like chemotaxis protein